MKLTGLSGSFFYSNVFAAIVLFAFEGQAQWVAFNDHVAGTGTHANTTRYIVPGVGATGSSSGPLTNIATAAQLPVILTISETGTITGGTGAAAPGVGTPAYNIFNGYVDFNPVGDSSAGAAIQTPTGTIVTYAFTNLDISKKYKFQGTAVRGGFAGSYTNRWSVYEIVGASDFTSAHTPGCITSAQEPADLTASQVAINTGSNTNAPPAAGEVATWDNIVPGPGGTFTVTCTRYAGAVPTPNSTTANNPPYGYAISGMRLEEIDVTPTPVHITIQPTNQTVVQCKSVTMSVRATGSSLQFQWFKNNQPIPGANSSDYTIASVQPSDTGDYKATVSNPIPSSETSSTAHLTVPVAPPFAVVGSRGTTNSTNIIISFNLPVDPASLDADFGFVVTERGVGNPLGVFSATVLNSTNVLLGTDPRVDGVNYEVAFQSPNPASVCPGFQVANSGPYQIASQVYLVKVDRAWQYNQSGIDPGPSWSIPAFDDTISPWQTGSGVFDGKNTGPRAMSGGQTVNTVLQLTNMAVFNGTNDIPTYNFRTHFNFPGATNGASLVMHVIVDDAAIIYINGKEAARLGGLTNLAPIPFEKYAGANDDGSAFGSRTVGTPTDFTDPFTSLPLTNLVANGGDNVLAVEAKQERKDSSDITFALELTATVNTLVPPVPAAPRITYTYTGGTLHLSWPSGVLEQASPLGGAWSPVTGVSGNTYSINPSLPASGSKRFYRLH